MLNLVYSRKVDNFSDYQLFCLSLSLFFFKRTMPDNPLDLTQRTLRICANLEEVARDNRRELEALKHLNTTLNNQVSELRNLIANNHSIQIKYLLMGIAIGLAGRQVLSDIYSLLK